MKVSEFLKVHERAAERSATAKFVNLTGADYQRLVALVAGRDTDLEDDRQPAKGGTSTK